MLQNWGRARDYLTRRRRDPLASLFGTQLTGLSVAYALKALNVHWRYIGMCRGA